MCAVDFSDDTDVVFGETAVEIRSKGVEVVATEEERGKNHEIVLTHAQQCMKPETFEKQQCFLFEGKKEVASVTLL